jgi:hypothetical protein
VHPNCQVSACIKEKGSDLRFEGEAFPDEEGDSERQLRQERLTVNGGMRWIVEA